MERSPVQSAFGGLPLRRNREAAFRGLCRYLQSQAPILPICFKTVSTLYESDVLEGLTPTAAEPFYGLENISIHLRAN